MTKKEKYLVELMKDLVREKKAIYTRNDYNWDIYSIKWQSGKSFLEVKLGVIDTDIVMNIEDNKGTQVLGKRQYKRFESELEEVLRRIKEDKERELRDIEARKELEERRNNEATFKNSYLDKLLEETRERCPSEAHWNILFHYNTGRDNGNTFLKIDSLRDYKNIEMYKELRAILEAAKIDSFILTEKSSALMDILNYLDKASFKIAGIFRYKEESRYSFIKEEERSGLRIEL